MASKSTLNQTNLEALGAARLAELLLEIATGDANAKRRLRLELTGEESPAKLAAAIRKRLASIAGTERNIGWRSLKAFKADLESQRVFIRERVAPDNPAEGLDLAWQLLDLCNGVLERSNDTSGEVSAIFRRTAEDIAAIARLAPPDIAQLGRDLARAVRANAYGQGDGLITALADILGRVVLENLRVHLRADPPVHSRKAAVGRRVSRWRRGRTLEHDVVARRTPAEIVRRASEEIADALGDIDAWLALQPNPNAPDVLTAIARRLIAAGRPEEGLEKLERVVKPMRGGEWRAVKLEALQALGRDADVQTFQLESFEATLDAQTLRDYLKRLPDFDDIEAEDAAIAHAETFPNATQALAFLTHWPAFEAASRLILARAGEIDPAQEDLLSYAAERLAAKYPLAAIALLRRMIEYSLENRHAAHYEAAGHMMAEAQRLSAGIGDWQNIVDQEAFKARLRTRFNWVTAFWAAAL